MSEGGPVHVGVTDRGEHGVTAGHWMVGQEDDGPTKSGRTRRVGLSRRLRAALADLWSEQRPRFIPSSAIGCTAEQCEQRIRRLCRLKFNRLGQQAGDPQRVVTFAAFAREVQVFEVLLRPAEPFKLDGRHRAVEAEPLTGIEPDALARVGRLVRR